MCIWDKNARKVKNLKARIVAWNRPGETQFRPMSAVPGRINRLDQALQQIDQSTETPNVKTNIRRKVTKAMLVGGPAAVILAYMAGVLLIH